MKKLNLVTEDVTSSNILSIGYDKEQKVMQITFKGPNGKAKGKYNYYPVEPAQHKAIMKAKSKGKHFIKEIKNNRLIAHDKVE